VGLDEDAVDGVDVDGAILCTQTFEQTRQAQIPCLPQYAFDRPDDEIDGGGGEGVVSKSCRVETAVDESLHIVGVEALHEDGVGDAAAEVFIDLERQTAHQGGLSDENEVMVFGEILEEQSQFSQRLHLQEMCVVDHGHEGFSLPVEGERLFDEGFFADEV
jgi:hypothetical protein